MCCLIPLVICTNSTRLKSIPEVKMLRARPGVRSMSSGGGGHMIFLCWSFGRTGQRFVIKKCERGEGGEDSSSWLLWFPREREKFFIFCFEREGEILKQKVLSFVLVCEKIKGKNIRASTPPLHSRDQQSIKKFRLRGANFSTTIFVSVDFTTAKVDSFGSLNSSSSCRSL